MLGLLFLIPLLGLFLIVLQPVGQARSTESILAEKKPRITGDRSPVALAISPDRQLIATANRSSGTVSIIHQFRGAIVAEIPVGNGPADIAWIDNQSLVVSLVEDHQIAFVTRKQEQWTCEAHLTVGNHPVGIAVVPVSDSAKEPAQERLAWVAVSSDDQIVQINLKSRQIVQRVSVGGLPRYLGIAPNGRWLVTGCDGIGDVYVHDAVTGELLNRRAIFDDPANLGRPAFLPDSSHVIFPHLVNRSFPVDEDNIEKGWVIDNRLTRLDLPKGEYWQQSQIALDPRGAATGDAHAVSISPNGRWLVVSCGGTHELLVFQFSAITWPQSSPGDFIASDFLLNDGRFRRIKLGGRPLDVEFLDDSTLLVVNYLKNELQTVDLNEGELTSTVALGSEPTLTAVRRGEAIFYDADRSLNSWFSCHSCHVDGDTNGRTFDTLNDTNFDTYKLTPSLRGVTETGPWTWHGWQDDLRASIRKSFRDTMRTRVPTTDQDVEDVYQFFASLKTRKNLRQNESGPVADEARLGWAIFTGKGGCAGCHAGETLTSAETYDVGTGSRRYAFPEMNPPSLRGLSARRRFMHDGRGKTLREVLTKHHRPENVAGEALTEAELANLLEYLRSL